MPPTLPVLLAVLTVGCQIAYPLVDGAGRDWLTLAIVGTFAAFSLTHAALQHGRRAALGLLLVAGGVGFASDVVGVHTGVPFGDYAYADSLGVTVLDVPLVITLAWTMMAYPALVAGRTLTRSAPGAVVVGAVALASWDLFLDPMMVDDGHWRWLDVTWSSPGAPHVPLSNYLGWFAVSLVLMAVLHRALRRPAGVPTAALAMYLWVYASSVLANAAFLDRAGVALVGGLVMGVVAVPVAVVLCRR